MEERGKKSLWLLAAHTSVLRSNLSGVLFASYFNKSAQWVYQTALMKGLLAGLPAADPLDPECVFTINRLVSTAGYIQSSAPSSLLPHPPALPHTQTATFTGASPDNSPSTPPATKPLLHHSTSPAHIHCSAERCGHTPSLNTLHFPALCRHVSTHMQHTDKVYEVNMEKRTPQKRKATHASSHACLDRNACAHTHTCIQYLYI